MLRNSRWCVVCVLRGCRRCAARFRSATGIVLGRREIDRRAEERDGGEAGHLAADRRASISERIRKYDQAGPQINAFIAINPRALQTADALDRRARAQASVRGPLHGIPDPSIKDNYATADMPTTAGSLALARISRPGRDAFMVKKLRDAGAIVIGKTNLHELAYGITRSARWAARRTNPYDLDAQSPGGSSGGTGAAVAANFGAAGMGTDTCGSIRNPSSEQQPVRTARHHRPVEPRRASCRSRTRRTSAGRSREP